ncbi:MAG: KilA-N domain-containing protein [Saprospiraceae bacterium]
MAKKTINLNGIEVRTMDTPFGEYLCITDLAKAIGDRTGLVIGDWFRLIGTMEYLKEWELEYNNADFNVSRYADIKMQATELGFRLSPKRWVEELGGKCIISKAGRYGGSYAHNSIALEFCTVVSPRFKLMVFVDYLKLKESESKALGEAFDFTRLMTKSTFPLLTEAIKKNLVPEILYNTKGEHIAYADEVDLLNVALFGISAKNWKLKNPNLPGNMRDYATVSEKLALTVLQGLNAKLIEWDTDKEQRFEILRTTARQWLTIFDSNPSVKKLSNKLRPPKLK